MPYDRGDELASYQLIPSSEGGRDPLVDARRVTRVCVAFCLQRDTPNGQSCRTRRLSSNEDISLVYATTPAWHEVQLRAEPHRSFLGVRLARADVSPARIGSRTDARAAGVLTSASRCVASSTCALDGGLDLHLTRDRVDEPRLPAREAR